MEEEGSSILWSTDSKSIFAPTVARQTALTHRLRNGPTRPLLKVLARWTCLSLFLCTLYICSTAVFDRIAGDEIDLWIADSDFVLPDGYDGDRGPMGRKAAERLFMSVPNATSAVAASRLYASKPHMAGTSGDFTTAKDFLSLLQRELGTAPAYFDPIYPAGSAESRNATLAIPVTSNSRAWIDVYYPILNTPLDRSVEILGDDGKPAWEANLEEVADETDPDAHKYADAVPAFHGLSANGEVIGKLVYANYGRKRDYDALIETGVNLNGTIVIARYGGPFRGLKVKAAQDLGAVGVLLYSDPHGDGTVTEENGYLPYPHGPARNPTSVQRGSVQFLSLYPGDPSTPGYPSYENSTRVKGTSYPAIPSLPISWANAQVLLKEIEADVGKNRTIKLVNHVDYKMTAIWNTMGLIPGHIKDEVIVVGNHRDAWVMGANDPSSGTVALHEVVRGLGTLLRNGWKPLRSILIASWDAEEYGLIGSTEWGEDFTDFIDKHVVAYLNLDSASVGSRFSAAASPSLAHLIRDTARDIPHPTDVGRTLWDARFDTGHLFGNLTYDKVSTKHEEKTQNPDSLDVKPLGSGSDYTVFLQHIGVASSQSAFRSTLHDPVYHYHSVFDSERWQEVYSDPGFSKHIAVAKHLGLQILRMSDAIVLPLNTTHYSYELMNYLSNVESIALASSIDVDLSSLRKSIQSLQVQSVKLDAEKDEAERELTRLIELWYVKQRGGDEEISLIGYPNREFVKSTKRIRAINRKLVAFERGFISKDGIEGREWYKHLGVAPGKWLGYGATTLPALTESLTLEKDAMLAKYEAARLTALINKLVKTMRV